MVDESKVLVIEDDESYRHDLDTVLGFLGEKTISVHSRSWSEGVEAVIGTKSEITVAIIGSVESITLENLLSDIHKWEACIPFVILGRDKISNSVNLELKTRIIAFLKRDLSYQSLLDALHKSKLLSLIHI